MNAVLTPPRPRSAQLAGLGIVLTGLAVTVGVTFALLRLAGGEPTSFERLTVANPTPYAVNVDVTGENRAGWLDLGSFRREGQRTVEEVADQGSQWVFRFSYGGVEAGELAVSREQLARDRWRIAVPATVGAQLRDAGLSESAT